MSQLSSMCSGRVRKTCLSTGGRARGPETVVFQPRSGDKLDG